MLGNVDADVYHDVARAHAVTLHSGQTLAAQAERGARLRAWLDFDACLAREGGNVDSVAEGCLRNGEQQVVNQVGVVADKVLMRLFFDKHLYVARHAAVLCGVALARHVHHHAFCHAGGDFYLNDFFARRHALAVAMAASVLDDGALAVAVGAHLLRLHHAEETAAALYDVALSVAGGAGFGRMSRGAARSVALVAGDVFAHLEFLGNARADFFEREAHFHAHVAAPVLPLAASAAAKPSEAAESAAEDIAEVAEDVVQVHAAGAETSEAAGCSVYACCAELVVAGTLVGVAQHVVGLRRLLELLFCLLVAGIAVGVVFDGHLLVGTLNLVGRGRTLHAEYLIIVGFFCHF